MEIFREYGRFASERRATTWRLGRQGIAAERRQPAAARARQICRRHQATRHAVSAVRALALRACQDCERRCLSGPEVVQQTQPFIEIGPDPFARIKDYPFAVSKARYQGEPVAAVIATSPHIADDAAELVQVEYEGLDAVVDAERALEDKVLLHEDAGTN